MNHTSSTVDQKEKKEDLLFVAVADCTGHGVPGAMVSVVCSNALNRAVNEFSLTIPGEILDKVRDLVLETFSKSESEVKDGMDISLVSIQKKATQNAKENKVIVKWAGANNPLWYIQNDHLKELKADKQPIGKHEELTPFTTHTLEFLPGNLIYLFTDGYADQFGGPKGKKFKYKQLSDLILSNSALELSSQKQILEKAFEDWKSDLEQIDDVCIMGIKL